MKTKLFFIFILSYFFYTTAIKSEENVYIELTIENEIITNLDINK